MIHKDKNKSSSAMTVAKKKRMFSRYLMHISTLMKSSHATHSSNKGER